VVESRGNSLKESSSGRLGDLPSGEHQGHREVSSISTHDGLH
jgi:hypothetical protein